MRRHKRKKIESDRKINIKNKNLMIDEILSYNPNLLGGIEIYKDANRDFILLIFIGALLIDFPLISVPCCILSMFYLIKMLQFIRFNSINNIVKKLAKDLSFKGIYDKEKVEDMLCDFKLKYGKDVVEYTELVNMVGKYEALVTKIEKVLKNTNKKEEANGYRCNNNSNDDEILLSKSEENSIKGNQFIGRRVYNSCSGIDDKVSVFYKKENGQVKIINKAIEFFDNEGNDPYNTENAVMLKNINKENKNLTVYLYKKTSDLQKNAL